MPTELPLAPSPPPCGTPGSGHDSSKLAIINSRSSATSLTLSSASRIPPDCDCK